MRITSTHRLTFVVDHKEFTTAGKKITENAPDWIVEDEYFRMNERAGRVTILGETTKAKADTPKDESKDESKGKGKGGKKGKKAESEETPVDETPAGEETETGTEDQTEGSNDLDDL